MSSGRRTLWALGIAAALGLTYWGWVIKLKPRRDKAKEDAKLIFPGTDAGMLKSMLLRKKGSADVRLERGDGAWRLVQPIQAPADGAVVEQLVAQLAAAKREQVVVDKGGDPRDFGLDAPSGAVTFQPTSPGAKPLALFFGMDSPTAAQAYAMVDGRPEIFLVGLGVKSSALKDAADLRDKTVWSFSVGAVQGVRVGSLVLSKSKQGAWTVGQGAAAEPGKGLGIEHWLEDLQGLKALSVPSEDGKGRFGLAGGPRIELDLGDGSRLTLVKGSAAKPAGFYAQLQGSAPVFILPASDEAQFKRGAAGLADRDAFQLSPEQVDRFDVDTAAGTLHAAQKLGVWGWDGRQAPADEKAFDFSGFISRFAGAQILKRLPPSRMPAKPVLTVTFYTKAGTLAEKALFGAKEGPGLVAYSVGKRAASLVTTNMIEGLPPAQAAAGKAPTPAAAPKQP
jgi:hypothetical protein